MKTHSAKNQDAVMLCLYIDELTASFKENKFEMDHYTAEELGQAFFLLNFFGLTEIADLMVLLVLIEKRTRQNGWISLEDISARYNLTLMDCVNLHFSLDSLVSKRLVKVSDEGYRSRDKEYAVSQKCMDAIFEFDKGKLKPERDLTFENFMLAFQSITEDRNLFGNTPAESLMDLVREYAELPEICWLVDQELDPSDQYILLGAVRSYIFRNPGFNLSEVASELSHGKMWLLKVEKEMVAGGSPLLKKGLVDFRPGPYREVRNMQLTQKSVDHLCASVEPLNADTFRPKYFRMGNAAEATTEYIHDNPDLRLVEKMVSREHYETVKDKVPRLTILLTGPPGVGKTSFVSHLSRLSGRMVLSVNIAEILATYVGESEKNLVNLFREAEQAFECLEVAPIIVLDEAETLLYKRNAQAGRAVDQMSNNLISLLLASLDNFRGILICCSNFGFESGSFDPALHRRFHLVSEIPAPPVPVMRSILKSHFPALSEGECDEFLDRYPFVTPAQIRHIREKYDVQSLLGETSVLASDIDAIARKDLALFVRQQHAKIGFGMRGTKKMHNFSTSN